MAPPKNGKVVITIPQSFSENYKIPSSIPQPVRQGFDNTHLILEFNSNGPVLIMFEIEAEKTGNHTAEILINDQVFTFSQFIYP